MQYVKVDLSRLKRFAETVQADLRGTGSGPIRAALRQWAARFRAFIRERFVEFSRGGGDWPGLRPSTLAARARRSVSRLNAMLATGKITHEQYAKRIKAAKRTQQKAQAATSFALVAGHLVSEGGRIRRVNQGSFAGSFAILRDTGTLLAALDPTTGKPGQLQQDIPFGVRVGYGGPARHPKGKATIADITSFHQEGGGHLPCRKIIVNPPGPVQAAMAGDMQRAVDALARQANQ